MQRRLARACAIALAIVLGCGGSAMATEAPLYRGLEPDRFMTDWMVLGPVPISRGHRPDETEQRAAFAADLLEPAGGEAAAAARAGTEVVIDAAPYRWRRVQSTTSIVDLRVGETPEAFSIAYAWADIDVPAATTGLLGIGSDDGVKVWLNGRLVHEHWIARAPRQDDDLVSVALEPGRNTLLLKIQNIEGPWGFACRLLGREGKGARLIAAARDGDLDQLRLLLDHGAEVDYAGAIGLTALQTARLRGDLRAVDFLASRGADTALPMPPREKLTDAFLATLFSPEGPGAAVLVAKDGRVLFEKGYGLGNVDARVPVGPDTRFRIGSITKPITAAAILKLVEDGQLSLDDTLARFIPDYPRGDEVTIAHLLTHTSGIHSYTSKPDFVERVIAAVDPAALIDSFKNDPYDFDPGQRFAYNNSAYFLLGHIIETVSGRSYGDYLRETFFEPLGMHDTGVHAPGGMPHEAIGYAFAGDGFTKARDWHMSWAGAAGALYSTVGDLHRWNEALFSGRVLSEASLRAAFTPVSTADDGDSTPRDAGYGYGWSIQPLRGTREISHGGGLQGFGSYLLRLPDHALTIVVLANALPPPPGAVPLMVSREIVELYLGDELPPRESPQVDPTVTTATLDAVVGRYDYGAAVLTVTRERDQLFAQLGWQPRFEIYPKSETTFFWKVVEAEVTFVRDDSGVVTQAVHRQGGQTITAPKLADVTVAEVDPARYDAYVGRYDYGGSAVMTVTREGRRLFGQIAGQPRFEILPASETEFFVKEVNARITFVRDEDGRVTHVTHEQAGRRFDAPRLE